MPGSAHAVTLPKTAKLVPPETIALVDIDDFSKVQTQFEKTSFYKLYTDPVMSPFVDDLKAKWKTKKKEEADDKIPGILRDLDVWPQGRIAIAFIYDEQAKDANEPPILFITQWGEQIGKVKETAAKNVEKAIGEGARREAEDYRGVSITTMTSKSSKALSYCFLDDCLIGSVSPNTLKFVIAHVRGAGSPTLGDDDDYNTTFRALGSPGAGQAGFYVNIKRIIKLALAEDADGKARTLIDNLGLNNVTSFGGTVDLTGGPGGSILGKALLKINGDKKGICKMLEVESAGLRLPRFVPASSSSVSVIHLNIKKAFTELVNIMNSFSPQMAAMLQMPLAPPSTQGEPPLQLQTGVIDYLGSQIVLAQTIKKASPDTAGSSGEQTRPTEQSLVAIAINNRSALEKSLALLHSTLIARGNPDAQRQLLGYTIYSVDTSGFLPFLGGVRRPGAEEVPSSAFTVADTHLIFGGESTVEQAIRALDAGGESIDSARWFARAKASIPSTVGIAGLEDSAATAEQLWIAMREAKKEDGGGRSHGEMRVGVSSGSIFPQMTLSQMESEYVDFSLLPEFDAVRKYFGISTFYGISRPDGFYFEMKYLAPTD
ncbi:MAG: DUF3352 domain-containing protein [Sedimentisphaerales bacterium]|jgi:hypothetical protein